MGISGSQKAPRYALSGVARAGATRSGYTSPRAFVLINGAPLAQGSESSLSITEVLHEVPNTAAVTLYHGATEPAEGQDVVVTLGSINDLEPFYAGTILNRTHGYVGTPGNWNAPINVIDYTWQLTRRRFTGSFTNAAPADIAAAIVAVVPGFTLYVQPGLANLDAFSQTDVTALQALVALAKRIGGYCDVSYRKVVKLFTADSTVTNPVTLTAAHQTLEEFSFTKDLSQVRTRIYSEGGGVAALADVAVGTTSLPVDGTGWYNGAGGTVKCGAQHLTYAGLTQATPNSGPTLVDTGGSSGLSFGATYGYAVVFVTAAGKTLPSPIKSITFHAAEDPALAPTLLPFDRTGGLTPGAVYKYRVTYSPTPWSAHYVPTLPETIVGPESAGFTASASGSVGFQLNGVPSWVRSINIYRTEGNGSTYFLEDSLPNPINFGGQQLGITDAVLVTQAPAPTVASYTNPRTAISAVALGPSGTTSREIHRTVANGSQLKLQQTIANNTATTGVTDATPDASLGADAPTTDTSTLSVFGMTTTSGATSIAATTLNVTSASSFSAVGGWVTVGAMAIRYTGKGATTLTGIPASGSGSISGAIPSGTVVQGAAALMGIPASGAGSILYPIKQGDSVNLLVQVDDSAAQTALAALIGGGDDGVIEEYIQDGRVGETEARARATAQLALLSTAQVSIAYKCRDRNTHAGRTITVNFGAPTNLSATFQIQRVNITGFKPGLLPTFTVQASNNRFSLEDLLRMVRQQAT